MRFSQHRANLLHIIWSTNPNVNLEASHMCSACTIVRSEVKPYDMSKQRQTLRIGLHSIFVNHIHALVVQTCIIYPWTDHHKDVSIVDIEERRKLTPSDSKNPVVLPLGKLMPSVDYFWKLIYMQIWPKEKVATGTCAVWLFPVQST